MADNTPQIVTICGGSASGKTTISQQLRDRLGPDGCEIVPLDSYYFEAGHMSFEERCSLNFDHPDAFEFELLAEHLRELAVGHEIAIPHYDFCTHTRVPGKSTAVMPLPVILVEGILTLYPEELRALYQHAIFVEADEEVRFERRLRRDVCERGRTEESVREQWLKTVQPMYAEFCEPAAALASLKVSGVEPVESVCDEILEHLGINE